ncbi:MAG: MFS transporter [Candidatus Dormibacteraeota bacterium]|nr:MFS transporter [Candidatus Dormibacteraeota bacterium]
MRAEERSGLGARGGAIPRLALAGLLLAIVAAAVNLRPSITGVGAVIGSIKADTGISNTTAGLLVTLPLIGFAALAPFAPRLSERLGSDRTMAAVLVLLATGIAIRSLPGVAALFAGTAILGAAIAVGNVLMPTLVKRHFPGRPGLLTGFYTTALSLVGSLAPGLTVLVAVRGGLGWRAALGLWAVLAALGAAIWLPRIFGDRGRPDAAGAFSSSRLPLGSGLAWQVTVFMGGSALSFYVTIAWLPQLLESRGFGAVAAGWTLSASQLAGLVVTFGIPVLAGRLPNQRALAAIASLATCAGFGGLIFATGAMAAVWAVLLGLGQSATFSLALTLMVLRARDAGGASGLAGMAQSGGYLLAAAGPVLIGALHDASGSWTVPLVALAASSLVMMTAGILAGANAQVA